MAQVINTNMASLNAQRNLNKSQGMLNTSLQRLSSGMRINSAKDDAAGLAISERFTAQIRGLNQAVRNSNDGISLAQTAEGALGEVTNNLQRIRELAVQSSNATNSSSDRAAMQQEVSQLISEIDRVASQTNFNGVKLLDGTFTEQTFQVGANVGETISIASITDATKGGLGLDDGSATHTDSVVTATALVDGALTINGNNVGAVATADALAIKTAIETADDSVTATATNTQTIALTDVVGTDAVSVVATTAAMSGFTSASTTDTETYTLDVDSGGLSVSIAVGTETASGVALADSDVETALMAAIAGSGGAYTSTGDFTDGTFVLSKTDGTDMVISEGGTGDGATAVGLGTATNGTEAVAYAAADFGIELDGVAIDMSVASAYQDTGTDATITGADYAAAINAVTGFTASFAGGDLTVTKDDGSNFTLEETGNETDAEGSAVANDVVTTYRGTLSLEGSAGENLVIGGTAAANSGLAAGTYESTGSTLTVETVEGSNAMITAVDAALDTINGSRATLGAVQNRFESVVTSLQTSSESLSAARSRIQDTDFAAETANLTKSQILQQAGMAMMSQANSLPQNVLSLLQ